jgi:hypothetical protein
VGGWMLALYFYMSSTSTSPMSPPTTSTTSTITTSSELRQAVAHIAPNSQLYSKLKGLPVVNEPPDAPPVVLPVTPITQTTPTKSQQQQLPTSPSETEIHVVFSTDCTFFQDWQTLVVFHSAGMVGQRGPITRIASGCKEDKQAELRALYKKLYPQYHVHFTPDFKTDGKSKKKYDFYNKPFGVEHWLDNADPPVKDGVVIALIDPDFIFLRPLTVDVLTGANSIPFTGKGDQLTENAQFMKEFGLVGKGKPAGQRYGLGAPWATNNRNFNRTDICGPASPCMKVHYRYGEVHYRYASSANPVLVIM